MFSINCLEITATKEEWVENQSLYKNLLSKGDYDNFDAYKKEHPTTTFSKRFFFNDFYYHEQYGDLKDRPKEERTIPDDFFGKNINIQAIVGKNGSGKSSLMDLMYMAINNFCYMFERGNKRKRPGAAELYFIPNLHLNLHFFNGVLFKLVINDDCVFLKNNTQNKPIFEAALDKADCKLPAENRNIAKKRYSDSEISDIVKDFFYSIISNYSMQSFVDDNYHRKIYFHADQDDIQKKISDEKYTNHDCLSSNEVSWISPIFHKNDGYIRSIVLNPYRNNGRINLANEFELSKDRVASLFLLIDTVDIPKRQFFRPYKFSHLLVKKNTKKIENYLFEFLHDNDSIETTRPPLSDYLILNFFKNVEDSFGKAIKKYFELPTFDSSCNYNEYENYCYCVGYIKIKLYKITKKYPSYKPFKNDLHIEYSADTVSITCEEGKIDSLLNFVINNPSHITKKIRRTVNFLCLDKGILKEKIDKKEFGEKFNNESVFFQKKLPPNEDEPVELRPKVPAYFLSPQLEDDCLPPPLFDWNVILNKTDKEGHLIISKDTRNPLEIPYNQLSSGEIQFLQTISIHAYHLMNLISVTNEKDRPKYKNFNLVFDEVEICFHPEMQRQFIKLLIRILTDLGLPEDAFINIFIITHSPFILSDIPATNILYLNEGSLDNTKKKHSFAQNIGDMMYDSFFMEKTIGDFAEGKIRKLIKKRFEKDPTKKQLLMSDAEEQAVLNCIGDPIIRSLIDEIEAIDD
ncbi:MAG: AAA family ATPase [Fibrobacter sp.]|uniref:AAA family ATPase n=1 Tax=Fibrobacter sp. TaxID=35828 RepID=UPI0025BC0003|nr:AAA family ATPase [Fibrobacter sp.]MBQ9226854.1 AAA family ATPase [Fibrobacter sp.]